MALQRRGGRNSYGRRKRPKQRRRSTSTSDENSSDGGSTTRCVCGETHSVGLMVQCDKCEVWQHCSCMGLEQPDIPDQYYCEQCKPENHKVIRLSNGRTRRQYVDSDRSKAPKKRTTLNSREASMSLEDVLAARNALEMYEAHKDDMEEAEEEEEVEEEIVEPPSKRKKEVDIKLPETIIENSEPPSSTVSSVGHDEPPPLPIKEQEEQEPPKSRKRQVKSIDEPTKKKRGNKQSKRGKPRSRPSTPVRESSPMTPQSDLEDDQKDSPKGTQIFDYFTPEARAASPPAKVRYPNSRMSIAEMNRRANQILEYISSIQVEMATKENNNNNHAGHGDTTAKAAVAYDNDDDNDSLSSASTIPLDREDEDEEDDNDIEAQTAFELMDRLTRKLIKFQKKFGSRNRSLFEDETEGRITRSNGNNSFRSF